MESRNYVVEKIRERKSKNFSRDPRDFAYINVSKEQGIKLLSGDKGFLHDLELKGLELGCNEDSKGKYKIRKIGGPVYANVFVQDHIKQLRELQCLGEDY